MSEKRLLIAVLAALAILAASAAAQDQKNELTGIIGRTFISDQGISGATFFNPFVRSGKGLTFEVNYARLFLMHSVYSVSAEVPVAYNPDEDLNSGGNVVPIDYSELFIAPSVRANLFPTTAISPWVSFFAAVAVLLREGFEAVLIILALLGVIRAAGAKQAARWVHGGWMTALLLGAVAWVSICLVAGYLFGFMKQQAPKGVNA